MALLLTTSRPENHQEQPYLPHTTCHNIYMYTPSLEGDLDNSLPLLVWFLRFLYRPHLIRVGPATGWLVFLFPHSKFEPVVELFFVFFNHG